MSKHFACYIHSDAITSNKGVALVAVEGETAFDARAARLAYGATAAAWADVAVLFPEAEAEREAAGARVVGVAVLRLNAGEAGRVEAAAGPGGAVAVKVVSATDFGARTEAFRAFAARVAEAALRLGAGWEVVRTANPDLEAERVALAATLREPIAVAASIVLPA